MHSEVISYAWPQKILAGVFKNYLKTLYNLLIGRNYFKEQHYEQNQM